MEIRSLKQNNLNFTSVIPVKVIINGQAETDPVIVKKILRMTNKIIQFPQQNMPKQYEISRKFYNNIDDFNYYDIYQKNPLRNYVGDLGNYIFTGVHSLGINNYGKSIGKIKSASLKQYGTTHTSTAIQTAKNYFLLIRDYIYNSLKDTTTPKLNIFAENSGKNKFNIEKISFEPEKQYPKGMDPKTSISNSQIPTTKQKTKCEQLKLF